MYNTIFTLVNIIQTVIYCQKVLSFKAKKLFNDIHKYIVYVFVFKSVFIHFLIHITIHLKMFLFLNYQIIERK